MSEVPLYTLDDPRPIAAEARYTYFLPSPEELAALAPGDMVKLVFRPTAPDRKFDAERMWVTVEGMEGDRLRGRLENTPDDIPGLLPGAQVAFNRYHVVDCVWDEERVHVPERPPARTYWERCLVDRCVLEDGALVHFLYREEPEVTQEDQYPDSGWRIRGGYRGLTDTEMDARELDFVALGPVLNRDDSWLHLIDSPIGSAFIRDWDSGEFVAKGES